MRRRRWIGQARTNGIAQNVRTWGSTRRCAPDAAESLVGGEALGTGAHGVERDEARAADASSRPIAQRRPTARRGVAASNACERQIEEVGDFVLASSLVYVTQGEVALAGFARGRI